MEEAYLFDGSVSRIWIGSYDEPSNASEGLPTEVGEEEEGQPLARDRRESWPS